MPAVLPSVQDISVVLALLERFDASEKIAPVLRRKIPRKPG